MPFAQPNNLIDIRQQLARSGSELSLTALIESVKNQWPLLSNEQVVRIVRSVDSTVGVLEPLESLISDPRVTDIVINGFADIWFDDGDGLKRAESPWVSEQELRDFAQSLVDVCDRRLDSLNPFVDLQLPTGIRAHIVVPPISHSGTHISLRIPRSSGLSIQSLLAHQDSRVISILKSIVDLKVSFMVCGSTGSGKTTLLRALFQEVDSSQRVVVIEDVQELNLQQEHVVSLQGRIANSENAGEVTMRQLVRQSLRMRPDRIVVGEIRGVEVLDLFTALNTGHSGSAATIHSNSASDVVSRVHMLGLLAGMTTEAIHAQIASALDVVIEVQRDGNKRVVREIGVLQYSNEGHAQYVPALRTWPDVYELDGMSLLQALGVE